MASLTESFAALTLQQGVVPGTKRYRRERDRFITNEFQEYFGEETKLLNWQKLCTDVGIEGPLKSITQCRKVPILGPFSKENFGTLCRQC
jgi:hypothetical protein